MRDGLAAEEFPGLDLGMVFVVVVVMVMIMMMMIIVTVIIMVMVVVVVMMIVIVGRHDRLPVSRRFASAAPSSARRTLSAGGMGSSNSANKQAGCGARAGLVERGSGGGRLNGRQQEPPRRQRAGQADERLVHGYKQPCFRRAKSLTRIPGVKSPISGRRIPVPPRGGRRPYSRATRAETSSIRSSFGEKLAIDAKVLDHPRT